MIRIKKLIKLAIFDALIWLAIYSIFKHNEYAVYATNFIRFICWTYFIVVLITMCNEECRESAIKAFRIQREKQRVFKFQTEYSSISTFIEALAIATVGLYFTATAYSIMGMCMIYFKEKSLEEKQP